MLRLVTERIKELRKEIDGIRAANETNLRAWDTPATKRASAERRAQRLQEIMDELLTLTEWKKP
jgi:hypothetical protein